MKVLIACEESGVVRDAFIKKGHYAVSCDLKPARFTYPHYHGDVFDIINNGWDIMIAHPPCTFLTVARNKYYNPEYSDRFPTQQQDREDAVIFFMKLVNANINKICIENPVGIMSTRYRKSDQVIQPYFFGDKERKATCIWLKNLPKLKYSRVDNLFEKTTFVKPEIIYHASGRTDSRLHFDTLKLPKEQRSQARSKTFQGIADAMADQWG